MSDIPNLLRTARAEAGLSQVELARLAGTSQPALARYEAGIALPTLPTLERVLSACGRRLQIRAARGSARASSMRAQLGTRAGELRRCRRPLLDAARRRGVRKVRVFGSLARGEAVAASDVDLLVELAPGRTLLDLAAYRREAEAILGTPVDVATSDMLKDRIRPEVVSDALPL